MIGAAARPSMRRPHLSPTLLGYIARQFTGRWLAFFCGLSGIIVLVSTVDLLDRMANKPGAGFGVVLSMVLLRLPYLVQEVMPFSVLFAGLATFWRLTRQHELVVARATGVSVWQFLLPTLGAAAAIGILTVTVLNPVASALLGRYERIEASFENRQDSTLALSRSGLWLRQADPEGQSVIHAARASPDSMTLYGIIVFRFGPNDRFLSRIDAARAELGDGAWRIFDASLSRPGARTRFVEVLDMDTELTPGKILESFAAPETISFWSLPSFVRLLENAGFSAHRHKMQLNRLLATPLLLAAMIMLAAAFSLRPQRQGHVALVIVLGLLAGFLLYFLSNFVFALGLSGKIPVILAGWAPAVISAMLGIALLLHLEDG
jgi:lipopolysaccharide export system permease protein